MSSRRKRSKQQRASTPGQADGRQSAGTRAPARPAKPAAPVKRSGPAKEPRAPRQPGRAAAVATAEAPLDRAALVAAGLVGLIALVVYLLTVDPSVPTGDSGELITSAYVLGVAHPPGYPLFTMLGHLASLLPFGSPALRINLLSCLFDGAAVSVVFLAIYRLIGSGRAGLAPERQRRGAFVASAVGALLLAFSTLFWDYSVVAEVFALNNLLAALLLWLGLEWCRRPDRTRLLWAFAFLFGLALTNQQTIVLLVPAFGVLGWAGWSALRRAGRGRGLRPRDLAIAGGLFVAGLLPYLYLPLAAGSDPVVNWGNPTTLGRFFSVVTRASYGSTSLTAGGGHGRIGGQLRLLSTGLGGAFLVVGIILALLGLWWTWRHRRAEGLALLVAFVVSGPIFVAYANPAYPDQLIKGAVARFYILPSIPIAMLAGLGAWSILVRAEAVSLRRLRPGLVAAIAAVALLAAPAAAAVVHYRGADRSGDDVALHYAQDVLGGLAPNALLLMRGDENYTSVSYAQYVAHFRPDVVALDTELLKLPNYVAQKRREHPGVVIPFASYDGATKSLDDLVRDNVDRRPVYFVGAPDSKEFGTPFDELNEGLTKRLRPKSTAPETTELLLRQAARFEKLRSPTRAYPSTSWEAAIADDYGSAAFGLAFALQGTGDKSAVEPAERLYRTAIRLSPEIASSYKDLGLLLHDNGGDPREIVEVWTRYLQLEPNDPQAPAIRSVLDSLKGTT